MKRLVAGCLIGLLLVAGTLVYADAVSPFNQQQPATLAWAAGIGYFGSDPFLILTAEWDDFAGDLGLGYGSSEGVSLFWYVADGRYIPISFLNNSAKIYVGGGIIGAQASASIWGVSMGVSATGLNIVGGAEFSLSGVFNIPVSIYAGADFVFLGTLSGQGWHMGIRWWF